MSSGLSQFALSYVISPIFFVGGIAQNTQEGYTPIISLLQPVNRLPDSFTLQSVAVPHDYDNYFAHFDFPSGSTMVDFSYGQFPFANQYVAANAVIFQPIKTTLLMHCPWRQAGDAQNKQAIMASLQAAILQHANLGGTYTVFTPSLTYTNMLLSGPIRDVSSPGGSNTQRQFTWQWDFYQPLITLPEAQMAQNSQMKAQSNFLPIPGDPPSVTGQPPTNAPVINTGLDNSPQVTV